VKYWESFQKKRKLNNFLFQDRRDKKPCLGDDTDTKENKDDDKEEEAGEGKVG
jgi:hypothetical protein